MNESLMRTCPVSKLRKGVCFSFEKDGKVYVAGDRYIKPGKAAEWGYQMDLIFFGIGIFAKRIRYKLSNAHERYVYLHDLTSPNTSAKQYELTVKYQE